MDGNSEDVSKRNKKSNKNRRALELMDLRDMMSSPGGRRAVHGLLDRAGIYRPSFDPNNPYVTSYNEGSRDVGVWLHKELKEASESLYIKMIEEAKESLKAQQNNKQ